MPNRLDSARISSDCGPGAYHSLPSRLAMTVSLELAILIRERLTLALTGLHDPARRRQKHSKVEQAADEHSRQGDQRAPFVAFMEETGDTRIETKQCAAGKGQCEDSRSSRLDAKVDGEEFALDAGEDRALGVLEQNGAA